MTDTTTAAAPTGERARNPSSLDLVQWLLRELPALVGDRVELFSLEMHRAGAALVRIAALAVAAAIFALTAWIAMWGVIVGLLLALGWHWAAAHAVALAINLVAAVWAVWHARSLVGVLGLPATRRHLMFGLRDSSDRARDDAPHAGSRQSTPGHEPGHVGTSAAAS